MSRRAARWMVCLVSSAAILFAAPSPLLVFITATPDKLPQVPGWAVVGVTAPPTDAGMSAIEAAIQNARARNEIDPLRTYISGQGEAVPTVFYALSRLPGTWTAALALGGSPRNAIDTNRLYGANTSLAPMLWLTAPKDRPLVEPQRRKLLDAGFNLEAQPEDITVEKAFEWLGRQVRDQYPAKVDCETGNPQFAKCYWVEMTKFDPRQRNDALPMTRVKPGSGATLGLGGFGFKLDAPGPGVLVEWLPENYKGPLKLGDRIVSIAGKDVRDAVNYTEMMDEMNEEKTVGVVIERGKERRRLETRISIPVRPEAITVRVQAQYMQDSHELLVITRGVTELRVALPGYWTPGTVNWNGNRMGTADAAGCWLLAAGGQAKRCQ